MQLSTLYYLFISSVPIIEESRINLCVIFQYIYSQCLLIACSNPASFSIKSNLKIIFTKTIKSHNYKIKQKLSKALRIFLMRAVIISNY